MDYKKRLMKSVVIFSAISLAVLAFFYLYRDLNLTASRVSNVEVSLESLVFSRKIQNRQWDVRIAKAEKRGDLVAANSLDIHVQNVKKGEWMILHAVRGASSDDFRNIRLDAVSAEITLPKRRIRVSAMGAQYNASHDVWFLGPNVLVRDDTTNISSTRGKIEANGTIFFEGDVKAQWIKK